MSISSAKKQNKKIVWQNKPYIDLIENLTRNPKMQKDIKQQLRKKQYFTLLYKKKRTNFNSTVIQKCVSLEIFKQITSDKK